MPPGGLKKGGATEQEIMETVETGERFPARQGRTGFRKNFEFDNNWNGIHYAIKQIEAFAVNEDED